MKMPLLCSERVQKGKKQASYLPMMAMLSLEVPAAQGSAIFAG